MKRGSPLPLRRRRRQTGLGLAEIVLMLALLGALSVAVTMQVVVDARRATTTVRASELQIYAEAFLAELSSAGNQNQLWLVTKQGLLPAGTTAATMLDESQIIDEIEVFRREAPVAPNGRRVSVVLASKRTFNAALVERFYE